MLCRLGGMYVDVYIDLEKMCNRFTVNIPVMERSWVVSPLLCTLTSNYTESSQQLYEVGIIIISVTYYYLYK